MWGRLAWGPLSTRRWLPYNTNILSPAGDKLVQLFRTHWYGVFDSLLNSILALRGPLIHLILILQLAICQINNLVYDSHSVNVSDKVIEIPESLVLTDNPDY